MASVTRSSRKIKSETRAGGRPTLREKERLDRDIRESALNLFLERGFDGISMDGIASAAGTTKVSVYARFESKEALFSSVLWWALERDDWPLPEPPKPDLDDLEGALTAIGEAAMKRSLHPAMIKLGRLGSAHAIRFPDIARRAVYFGISSRYRLLTELFERHRKPGTLASSETKILAEHFLAMVSVGPALLASFDIERNPASDKRRVSVAVGLIASRIRSER